MLEVVKHDNIPGWEARSEVEKMAQSNDHDHEIQRSRQRVAHHAEHRAEHQVEQHTEASYKPGASGIMGVAPATSASLLGSVGLNGRGNGSVRIAMMQQMQRTHGNHAVQRLLQRRSAHTPSVPLPIQRSEEENKAVQMRLSGLMAVQRAEHKEQPEEEGELLKERLHTNSQAIQRVQHKEQPEEEEELLKEHSHKPSEAVQRTEWAKGDAGNAMVQRLPTWLGGGKKTAAATGAGGAVATIPSGPSWTPGKHVVPNFKLSKPGSKRSNSDSSTMTPSKPTFKGEAAIDSAAKVWRFQVNSVEGKGKIQIVYFDKSRYPAPSPSDDSGALTNVTKANYQEIIDDLQANRTGIPDNWSAYRAEDIHEDYHWVNEWQATVKPEVVAAENAIAALQVDFTTAPSAAKAKKELAPQAETIFKAAMKRATDTFWGLGDSPGDPPYIAQAPALDSLRVRVANYAQAKGW